MTFASHALSHIGIPGATGAVLLGLNPLIGLATFCFGGGVFIAKTSSKSNQREIATGTTLAFALGLGLFFSSQSSKAGKTMQSVLFGSINTISDTTILVFSAFTLLILIVFFLIYKKLLLSSINPEVASALKIKTQGLNLIFIGILCITTVMSVQTLGALLPFALMITPAAAASNFSARPRTIIILSIIISATSVASAIFIAIIFNLPTSFVIVSITFLIWLLSKLFV
jgi:zinc/manganese transport system permease protein